MSLLFFILRCFLAFYPHNSPKNQIKKKKKTSEDIILHMCIIDYD